MKLLISKPIPSTALLAAALISWSPIAAAQGQETRKDQAKQAARSEASGSSVKLLGRLEAAPGAEIRTNVESR